MLFFFAGDKPITDAPDRPNQRLAAVVEFFTKLADVHGDASFVCGGFSIVKHGRELVVRDDPPSRSHQGIQNIEFKGGERNAFASLDHLAVGYVKLEISDFNHRQGVRRPLAST